MIENPVTLPSIKDMLRDFLPRGRFSGSGPWTNEHMGSYLREQERKG